MDEKAVHWRWNKFLQWSADGALQIAFAMKIFWSNLTEQSMQSQGIIAQCIGYMHSIHALCKDNQRLACHKIITEDPHY